jgi:phage shock protein A
MSILGRFRDIMASNVNALLDKMEDPSKMVDQLLRNLNDDLGKVKSETAGVMAAQQRAMRALNECDDEIKKMGAYAEKAVLAGNDDDARKFLTKKNQLETNRTQLAHTCDIATENATKMRQMHDKLVSQIDELNSRRQSIKTTVSVAQTQQRINKVESAIDGAGKSMDAFSRMEDKANDMLDRANAMAELNTSSDSPIADLQKKYDVASVEVDDELAALKAKLSNAGGSPESYNFAEIVEAADAIIESCEKENS